MDEAIEIPPFPTLTWDTYGWAGEFCLPSWAGFQSRRGSYASVSDAAPSDGTALLTVDAEAKAQPTSEQIAAFQHLLDNEASVAKAVAHALLDYYPGQRKAFLDAYDVEESEELPEVADLAGLRSIVGLGSIHVLSLARDGLACIGFEFGCTWDSEHGAGVMTHRGRVIATGQADSSFVEWIAEEGLDRQ
jgi:hypothetical protein